MWDKEFDTEIYVYGKEPNDFLRKNFEQLPKGKILCLAEGEGRNAVFLAKHGYQVTAVDSSQVGLNKAKKLAQEHNVEIDVVCADLTTYQLGENKWDGIVSIFCHLPPDIRAPLYNNIAKSLKPNGIFLIEGYAPEQLNYKTGGPPVAEMMISATILKDELINLDFSVLNEIEREVYEGVNHTGLASVVQGIATPERHQLK